ncbi:serpin B11 [Aedes albopictus]|uniref:Serpin domain-containing protein n=1 Tax=Aedes albopictus TaxID=7160 RepID=A0ABM1ZGB5_AEDAL
MNLRIATVVTFQLLYFAQGDTVPSKPLSVDYQAEFSWNLYKKLYPEFRRNMAISPYSLRKIFVCLHQLTDPEDPATSRFSKQLNKVFKFNPTGQLPDLVRRRYENQKKSYDQEQGLNRTTLVAVLGRKKKIAKTVGNLPKSCGIFARSLKSGSPKQMTRSLNAAMKNISNGAAQSFLSESDLNRDWDFFVADSWRFKGFWRYQFEEEYTTTCNFYTNAIKKGLMRFMYLEEMLRVGHFPQWNVRAVELPLHRESPLSCVLMMPVAADIEELIESLSHERFKEIYTNMSASKTTVRLPQFRLRMKLSAKSMLEQLGFDTAFKESVFRVFEKEGASPLGDTIQKMDLSMAHEGEELAKTFVDRSLGQQFTAHQPFMFVIFDRKELVPIIVGNVVAAITPKDIGPESDEKLCDNPPRFNGR